MNMLNNTTPYELLRGENRELFKKLKFVDGLGFYQKKWISWDDIPSDLKGSVAVRLKLKYGEYYSLVPQGGGSWMPFQYLGVKHDYDFCLCFRPATQEEIDSVKPKIEEVECLVKGCTNKRHEGKFIGDLCAPCHEMITTGEIGSGATFVHRVLSDLRRTEKMNEKMWSKNNAIYELANAGVGRNITLDQDGGDFVISVIN